MAAVWGVLSAIIFLSCLHMNETSEKGPHAVCPQGLMADIVFVVDGSSSVGWLEFEAIKDSLYTLVDKLYVGPDQVQLGLVLYSDHFQAEFRFNTYQTKGEILRHLRKLRQINDTKIVIGLGRDFLSSHYFTGAAGSRAIQGVPQIVVVITSSGITGPVKDNLLELKTHGINVYAIGIGCKVMGDFLGVTDKKYCVQNLKNFFDLLRPNQDITASFINSLCGTAKQHWLNIVLEPAGQGNAMVDNRVTLKRGKSLIVQCHYDEKYKDHVKYWCRMISESACLVIVRSDAPQNWGNVSINDHPHQHLFNVIINNLQTMDSAIYLCGVETSDMETYIYIADLNLTVTAGVPALSTHNNNAVVEVGGNVIFKCLYSEENVRGEKKWCRRGDWSSCLTETETRDMSSQNGVKLYNDKKYRILTVVIRGVMMNHTGWYWCAAGNQHLLYQINVLPQNTTFTTTPEIAAVPEAFTVLLDLVQRRVPQKQILPLLFSAATVLVYLVCTIVAVTKIWAYCKQKKDEGLSLTTQNSN
nr:uncharacterized protein LOC111860735 [Paramormyrops kingsleyae]